MIAIGEFKADDTRGRDLIIGVSFWSLTLLCLIVDLIILISDCFLAMMDSPCFSLNLAALLNTAGVSGRSGLNLGVAGMDASCSFTIVFLLYFFLALVGSGSLPLRSEVSSLA